MQFTREEQKMIEWLQRQHSGWRTTRMITLVGSLVCLVAAAWEFSNRGWGAMPLLLLLVGVVGLSHTLGSWSGRAEVSLLLKLIEAQRQDRPENRSGDDPSKRSVSN